MLTMHLLGDILELLVAAVTPLNAEKVKFRANIIWLSYYLFFPLRRDFDSRPRQGLMLRAFADAFEDDNNFVRRGNFDILLQSIRINSAEIKKRT